MKNEKHFINLKTKFMLFTLVPIIFSFVLICTVVFLQLFNSLQKTAEAEFLQISQKHAHSFETKLNNAMNYLSILSSELEVRVKTGVTDKEKLTDRATLKETVMKIFDEYGLIDGSSVYFEPNMYDGEDEFYTGKEYGTDTSGRICWYFYKINGKTEFLKEGLEDEKEFEMDHYKNAKRDNVPIYTDPVMLEINGKEIYMFTLTHPINNTAGEFIGAVTVDLYLDDLYDELLDEHILDSGYIMIANDNDIIIYSPDYEHIGETREKVGIKYTLPQGNENSGFFYSKSIRNGKDTLVTIETIYIPQLKSNFYLSVSAPLEEINAEGVRLITYLVIMGLAVITAIALLEYYFIGKISAPLNDITESVNKIAGGDYNARIKGAYTGEYAVVKNAVNSMADSIEAYIKESETSLHILKSILNGLDAVIYVSDPDTDEILFVNESMKRLFGIEDDATELICWKVFQSNFEKRCEFCPCFKLDKDPSVPIEWEEFNTVTKRYYRNTDSYINWMGGKKAHLQHSVDITEIKAAQLALNRRLSQQSLMTEISQSFLSGQEIGTLIENTLRLTGEFLGVAQVLFYKFEKDGVTLECQGEWISPELELQTRIGDKVVLKSPILSYIKNTSEDKQLCINSNNPEMKAAMAPYRTSFEDFMTTPILLRGELYGAIDFSMNNKGRWSESDIHLATLVASLLSGVFERYKMESELIVAKELAEQGSRSKSEFLSRMSHEIRTPMNAIIGMTKIADNTDDIQKLRYCLSTINSSSVHLLGIINDILDMSKIEAGKFELDNEHFNIEKMLMRICNLVVDRAEQKKQTLNINIGKKMRLNYFGDELRLSQVITNLLSNAVKFTPENGEITLSVDEIDTTDSFITLQFSVADNGIGMTNEQIQRLFNSFEQADGSISRKFGGTGLGLAISKSIIKKMDGDIWVESELGKGSIFRFNVKLEYSLENRSKVIFDGINASDLKLLVVEDNNSAREQFLEIVKNFQIDCDEADSGEKAIALIDKAYLAKKPYDVIFLDSDMSGMSGIEIVRRINNVIDKNTVIVMMAISEKEENKDIYKTLGVNRFMTKFLFPSSILNCINEIIGNTIKTLDIKADAEKNITDFSSISLLLVDDVEINREIFIALMEETGMNIDTAENGLAAVQKFKDNPEKFDMIIMDIQMPEMDGYEATRTIRALDIPTAKIIPIIAMTANAFKEDIEKCFLSGMNDHISKPIDVDKVIAKIAFYREK